MTTFEEANLNSIKKRIENLTDVRIVITHWTKVEFNPKAIRNRQRKSQLRVSKALATSNFIAIFVIAFSIKQVDIFRSQKYAIKDMSIFKKAYW